jgi:hypothetical protein
MSTAVGSASRALSAPTSFPEKEARYVYRLLLPAAWAVVLT